MKKIFILTLVLSIACSTLCACETSDSDSLPSETYHLELEKPTDHTTYYFDSYDALKSALTQKDSEEYSEIRNQSSYYGTIYNNTLKEFESGNIQMYVPKINGKDIPFRNRKGFSNIVLMTSELYRLPWTWYYYTVDNHNLRVMISYPAVLKDDHVNSAESYLEVLGIIWPDAPSPYNYKEIETYEKIYEKEITLRNGDTVTAMISEVENESPIFVMFYQNGIMIIVYADRDLLDEEFFKTFEVTKYEE